MSSNDHIALNVEHAATIATDQPPASVNENAQTSNEPHNNEDQCKPYVTPMEEPFKFAPEKPDGDPWKIILEPLLKADRAQCEIWKDDVQNLLIFAGLFSAVVTAFIIESYKTLQADPQDAMVSILSQILVRLDNSTTASLNPLAQAPFTPSRAAERINAFWFISLVLSIATALIGIISLQWLRVHQSYPNPESWELNFAKFNMRKDGLEAWHVPKVFTALPLLLQTALVLFLAGMIDFSLFQLGDRVAIPVMISVGLVLLFLFATTSMPTFQCLFLYFWGSRNKDPGYLPSQCPYKSPQAMAFFTLSYFLRKIVEYLNRNRSVFLPGGLSKRVVCGIWNQDNWDMFDREWLSLRHSISQEIFDRHQPNSHINPMFYFDRKMYLVDALSGLRKYGFGQSEVTREAAYHCITPILKDLLAGISNLDFVSKMVGRSTSSYQIRCGRYMQGLILGNTSNAYIVGNNTLKTYETPITDYLDLRPEDFVDPHMFRYQNIVAFFRPSRIESSRDRLSNHIQEIKIRFQEWLYSHPRLVVPSKMTEDYSGIPDSVKRFMYYPRPTSSWPTGLAPDVMQMRREILGQYSRVFIKYFACIANNPAHKWESDIHTTALVGNLLSEVVMIDNIEDLDSMSTIISVIIVSRLKFIPQDSVSGITSNNLLLYAGAVFLDSFPRDLPVDDTRVLSTYEKLQQARTVLLRYKMALFDASGPDALLENRFGGRRLGDSSVRRFTDEWWDTLGNSFLPTITEPLSVNVETENGMDMSHMGDAGNCTSLASRAEAS